MSDLFNYIVGENQAGCLPDNSPKEAATWDEAKAMLIHDLKFNEDYADTEDEAEAFCAAAEDANLLSAPEKVNDQVWVEVNGRVYFIMAVPGTYYGIYTGNGNWLMWSSDQDAISERFDRMTPSFIREYNVTIETLDADQVVNEYPQDQIPDALSYTVLGVTSDGGVICEFCLKNPEVPVHKGGANDGWNVVAFTHSGDIEYEVCDHCNREFGSWETPGDD